MLLCGCAGTTHKPAQGPDGPDSVEGEGVRAFLVQKRMPQFPEAIPGDFLLQAGPFKVQVAGTSRPGLAGAVIAIFDGSTEHDWETLLPLIGWDGQLHAVRTERVELARVSEQPAIVVHGVVDWGNTRLRVRRVVRASSVGGVLRIATRVAVERGSAPRELRIAEHVGWGGGDLVAPLAPRLTAETDVSADWIGRGMNGRAVIVSSLQPQVRIVARKSEHSRVDMIGSTDVFLPVRKNGDRFETEAVISTSLAGLGEAARRLGWVRGKPFPEAIAVLTVTPPGTQVRALHADTGHFVSSAQPGPDNRAVLPIPEAALSEPLVLVALARGREATDRVPLRGPPFEPVTLTIPAGARLEVVAEHVASGEPIPVRIRVMPLRGTPNPNLGPDWSASGALDTVIAPSGRTSIPLPNGYYRVIVTHGPEWSVHDEQIELGVGESRRLRARLEHVVDPGPWVPCEFHVHAAPSPDSQVALEDRVASLVAEGIAFAVPTDHNHVTDYTAAVRAQPLAGLASVPGVEVTTYDPAFGHFNAFPFPIDPDRPNNGAPDAFGQTPASLFATLHAIDPELVVQVNHPRMENGIGYFDIAEYDAPSGRGGVQYSDDYDTLEVWNGYDLARRELFERVFFDWLAIVARGRRVVATGSSDSHTIRSEGAGYPRTYVRAPIQGVTDGRALVRALRRGRAFVTSGPFLNVKIDDKGPGEEVLLTSDLIEVNVIAQVPSWMQIDALRIYLGTKLVHRSALGPPSHVRFGGLGHRYERKIRLPVSRPAPLVVVVDGGKELAPVVARGGVRPFAFTNPVWLVHQETPPPAAEPAEAPDAALGAAGDEDEDAHDHDHEHGHAP
jgi:hypothetical protein